MLHFHDLNIRNKLRVFSLFSIVSLIVLGLVSNYFYNTGKALSIIINAERVQNNTFQQGIEYYYKYEISEDPQLLDSAALKMEVANQMARNFGIIDQLLQLKKDVYINILYNCYKEGYYYDRKNAYLIASRLKLLVYLRPVKLLEAQETAMKGYQLGEKIKNRILKYRVDLSNEIDTALNDDLVQMRIFYEDFSNAITSINSYTNRLLYIGISMIVFLLILIIVTTLIIISKSITNPVYKMIQNVGEIANGNLNTRISTDTKNEIGELGIALNKMVAQLKLSQRKSELDSWFKSGINLLNEKLSGNQELVDISSHALLFMMKFLHSQMGSIYLFNSEQQTLNLLSSSGFDLKKLKPSINLNEGIVGQTAFMKEMTILTDIPDEFVSYSSTGEFKPRQIIVAPLLFNETLIGILELSSLQVYSKIELEFIQQASEIIAINLNSSESILKTNELLQKTQDQASELQVQQEELRVANEELVEHTKVLTENEKKLQVQQEELRVANEELEGRTLQLEIQKEDISKKNNELTEIRDKLELKAKELQLASQYKSEFLANMSHELRTPLNSLLILSNLLANNKKGNLTEEQVQSAKIIHKSGTDLLYLINDVLDLSKIEAGKVIIEMDLVKTVHLKEDILMNFDATAKDKNLSFNVNIDKNFPEQITTDRYRLMQIIKNLLSNAFKFTSTGGISVDFMPASKEVKFLTSGLNSDNTCCIKVTDTGVGIPENKLEAIFEAFQQADGSISRKFGGTGLGLSISKELIRMLGGEIQLESIVNKGSSFYVYLPTQINSTQKVKDSFVGQTNTSITEILTQNQISDVEPEEIIPFVDDDRNEILDDRTLLLIHPSKQQSEKFMKQARAKDFSVIVASNIKDGIILAEKYPPKAIMLAAELADQSNRDYQSLKNNPAISKLPVHLISPLDLNEPNEHSGLQTLETIEFVDALKSMESHINSDSKKVLVVEDNEITQKVIKQLLSKLDIEIHEANVAEAAYNLLTNEKFDCIILDLGLPDYSGKELLEKLKMNNIAIPKVIVYTGKDMSREEILDLNSYTDTIILKGIKSDERLTDEVTLFLHQVSKIIPVVKPKASNTEDDNLFKGKKILVVDDEIRNVFALGKILEEKDIEVLEAENGKVAVDILMEDNHVDLVLMDVMMPVMDGYEAMRIIRNTPEIKDIPIICLTAKAMKEDHENALKNGANDYLAKPLNEEKLFSMLKIWLYKK